MSATSTSPTASTTSQTRPFQPARLALAILIAAGLNLIAYGIGTAAGAAMAVVSPMQGQVPIASVPVATVVPMALAGAVVWLVGRRRPGLVTAARWAGLAVALLSVVSPLTGAADLATGLTLAVMHVLAGSMWFVGLRPAALRD